MAGLLRSWKVFLRTRKEKTIPTKKAACILSQEKFSNYQANPNPSKAFTKGTSNQTYKKKERFTLAVWPRALRKETPNDFHQ
eukprot:scaffold50198_cov18-Tisochrysis_lutea.AAC.1